MRARILVLVLLAGAALAKDEERKRPFLVLGKTQLLDGAKAYPKFCRQNAARKRSELRAGTVAALKKIAEEEQPALLKALGNPADARPLWLVNAVVVRMTDREMRKARKLGGVKFIYPAGMVPEVGPAGTVSEVIVPPAEREPFTTKKKAIPWNLKGVRAPQVWKELKILGDGVVVAMFDAGVNYRHTDLRNNMWINAGEVANNGKDDDGNGLVDDYYGFDFARMKAEVAPRGHPHGTWTSSIVAGDGTGGRITGVAPRAKIMPLLGSGGPYNAARAFQYALEQGADVVNMSFSIPNLGDTRGLWRLMAEHACASGLVMVSGAGNFPNVKIPVQIRIPEGIPCVICVGGVTKKKKFARFTSQGPVEWKSVRFFGDYPMPKGLIKPDVAAFPGPAIGIIAGGRDEGYMPENNGRRGNSFSAPHVAGICALMLSANPELTPWRVKGILEQTAKDIRPRGKDPKTGAGLVDAYKSTKYTTEQK